jgi:DNA-binding GntR family transcriptional regulator
VARLDSDDPRPPYRQVVDHLRAAVEAGDYPPGAKLPSYDALASEFGVSLGVVKRAMTQLRDERLVVTRHGQGSYVRTDRAETSSAPADFEELRVVVAGINERLEAIERRLSDR